MQWILPFCLLLASATQVLSSTSRPKRDLWSIKDLLSSKIFGTETIVIQLPKIPKNETSQLFKIKGYDNIYLKVTRKSGNEKPVAEKSKDSVIVSPEIAIIGRYLGTTTEGETLLALDIAKNLLKSGILSGERLVEIRKPVQAGNLVINDEDPLYVLPAIDSNQAIEVINPEPTIAVRPPSYQPIVVASEVKYKPFQTKYSYKQEGESADMMFESYNNQDVIVTRTNKVPVKPRYLALRLTEVAAIGANPYIITSNQPIQVITSGRLLPSGIKPAPVYSYITGNLPHKITTVDYEAVKRVDFTESIDFHDSLPNFVSNAKRPFDIRDHLGATEVEKLNTFINAKLSQSNKNGATLKQSNNHSENKVPQLTESIDNYKDYLDANVNYGNLVHRYVYQQIGDIDQKPTVVNIEDPKLNQTVHYVKQSEGVPKNFVYVPPIDADAPPLPNGIPNVNGYQENNINDYEVFGDSEPSAPVLISSSSEASNRPATTTKPAKTDAPVRHDIKNSPNSFAANTTQSDIENKPLTSTVDSVNKVSKKNINTTTEKPTENLAIIGLNSFKDMKQNNIPPGFKAGILRTNVQKNTSLKQNPIVVADIERKTTSTTRSFRPKLRSTSSRPYTGGPVF